MILQWRQGPARAAMRCWDAAPRGPRRPQKGPSFGVGSRQLHLLFYRIFDGTDRWVFSGFCFGARLPCASFVAIIPDLAL
jgi:hypothetical protein